MLHWLYRYADELRHRARERGSAATGGRGEDLAHRYLQSRGYRVVARNYRPPSGRGEIDVVAWDGPTLVFVEVKTRGSEAFGTPDRAVDGDKERFLARAAQDYARRAGVPVGQVRFDIVNVVMSHPPRLELIQDAFRVKHDIITGSPHRC